MQIAASRERTLTKECCHNFTKSPSERKSRLPTNQFIATLFTIAKICKQAKCPSVDEWIKELWCIYTMAYDVAIQKKEIVPFVTACMDLEITVLNEISQ